MAGHNDATGWKRGEHGYAKGSAPLPVDMDRSKLYGSESGGGSNSTEPKPGGKGYKGIDTK